MFKEITDPLLFRLLELATALTSLLLSGGGPVNENFLFFPTPFVTHISFVNSYPWRIEEEVKLIIY